MTTLGPISWLTTVKRRRHSATHADAHNLSADHVKEILTTVLKLGLIFNNYIRQASEAQKLGAFTPEDRDFKKFFDKMEPGTSVELFKGFILGKKTDGSPVCTADKESHRILVKLFQRIVPRGARFFEENSEGESLQANRQATTRQSLPVVSADELDNTKGFLSCIFNTDYDDAHQFSINLAVTSKNEKHNFGCFHQPLTDTLFYTHNGRAYKIDKASTPEAKLTKIEFNRAPDAPIRIVTSNSAKNPDKSPEQQWAAIERDQELITLVQDATKKSTKLLHATGINRIAMLLNGQADLAKSGAGMCWWDVRAGFEVCKAAGLAVAIHPDDTMPKFPSTDPLPELYFGNAELLKEMGLKLVYGKDVERKPAAKMAAVRSERPQFETTR